MTGSPTLRRRIVAATALGVAAAWFGAVAASAQTAPTTTTPAGEDQLIQAAIELSRTTTRLDVVAAQVADVQTKLQAAQAALAQITAQVNATQAQIDQLKAQIAGRAASVYEQHDNQGAVLRVQHVLDVATGQEYTNAASADANQQLDQLNAAQAQLQQQQAQRAAEEQAVSDDEVRLQATQASLEAIRARDEDILGKLGGIPVLGDARLTSTQLAGWFHSTGATAHLAGGTTIEQLTGMYLEEGAAEHVAGDLAFAQAILETGSFGHAYDSNFAGIGACDSCTSEIAFPSPRDGVRAQIQLLRSYADPESRAANLHNPPEPALFGSPPPAAAASYDTFVDKGVAPLWNVMGNGKWATDPDYAVKVLDIYARMLAFAAQH
jgi:Mannosyl-glycoprotein endo-beta-N-acetylglucosaminidase